MGQLKDWALDTRDYLDSTLAADGGAGQSVTDAVNALDDSDPATPATVAQFRSVMQPIYDRLIAAGYDTKASLIAHGAGADWVFNYPWPDTPAGPNDLTFDADAYAAWFQQQANVVDLGQARLALSFDLSGLTLTAKVIGPADGGISIRKNGHAGNAAEVEATANGNDDSSTAKNGSATIAKASGASAPAMQVVDNSELSLIVLTPLE